MENRRETLALAEAAVNDDALQSGQAKLTRRPFGGRRVYFRGDTEEVRLFERGSLELKPGMSPQTPHRRPEEEILIAAKGRGEIFLNGKTIAALMGAIRYCKGNVPHGIENADGEPLLFYCAKWAAK